MINRVLIRIKVLQIVYSYYQNETHDLKLAEKELMFSLQKSYNLYYYLLLLMVEVTRLHRRNLDLRKHKYVPGEEDLNPNTRLIDNRFVAQLEINEMLRKQIDAEGISWANDEDFVKDVLDKEEHTVFLTSGRENDFPLSLNKSLKEIEKEIARKVLEEEGGNQSATAKRLDISRTTLWRMLSG